ncbi:unnamed protein product [Aspergillus oryzae]|nr:unnamed protein product [Aspergillus oryzae]
MARTARRTKTAAASHRHTADHYWQQALASLDADSKAALSSVSTRKLDIMGAVLSAAEDKRRLCVRKQWKFRLPSGRSVVLRDVLEKVVGWIDRFKAVGDIAAQYSPEHVALPWAAFRFLLTVVCGDAQVFGSMVLALEVVARLATRCRVLEELYLRRPCDASGVIEEALVRLYAGSLVLLAQIIRFLKKSTGVRLFSGVLQLAVSSEDVQALEAREAEVLKLASLADTKVLQALDAKVEQLTAGTTTVLQDLNARSARLMDLTAASHKSLETQRLADLLQWLSSTPVAQHHRAISAQRLPGSGQWLLKHPAFQQWEASSSSSLLVLHGVPGCGKSTIFSACVDHFRPPTPPSQQIPVPTAPCAYFYCAESPAQPDRASPENVMRSIVRQLAVSPKDGAIDQGVLSVYERELQEAKAIKTDVRALSFEECIALILDLTMVNPAYIAVDAVDELQAQDRATLLEGLRRVISDSASVVKIFITSRDSVHLDNLLPQDAAKIRVTPDLNGGDVAAYVDHQLQTALQKCCILNGTVSSALVNQMSRALIKGSGEMFLWVKLQVDFLCRKKTEDDILGPLASLSANLDQIYGRTLAAILTLDVTAKRVAGQVLSWLLFARRPLSVEVLHGILQLDRYVQLSGRVDIIDICHNLVLVDPGLDTLDFCHPSAREFMQQQDLFSAARANQLIATICLQQCIAGPASDPDASQLSSSTLPVQELYHYTAVYWPEHVRDSENEDEKDTLMQDTVLFVLGANDDESTVSPAFLVWMEWIRSAIKDLPRYHQISSKFEPLLSTEMSPLFLACVFGLSDLLDRVFALNWSLDIEARSDTGHTGLYLACSYGHDHVVSKLLSHNADMNTKCGSFGTPFNVACFRGHAEVVQTLLAHKTAPRTTAAFSDAFRAACRGAREKVALLLAKAFLPIWTESEYCTALQESVEAGFRDLVEWLMSPATAGPFSSVIGPSPTPDQKGSTAERLLHTAIKRGQVSVFRSLLRMKPHLQDLLLGDAMALSSLSDHPDMLLALHDLGVNVDGEGVFGSTLRSASLMGNERAVRLLLSWGADPAASGSKGDALQAAAQNGHLQIVRLLLDEGADVNQTGPPRGTPVQAAAFYGHSDVVDLLLERGADMYKGGKSQDALYAAIEGGHEEVAALLLKKGYRVAAGADLPGIMRGSLDRVQRPWEKKRTAVGEQRGIGTDDSDDGLGGPLLTGPDAVDSYEEDCDVSPSDLKDFREYDHPDPPLFKSEARIGTFELSVVAGDVDMIRQLILRPDTTQYDVIQAVRAAVTAGQLNSLRALLDEQAAFFQEDFLDLNKQLILACEHGHAHIAQYLSLLVQPEVGGASLDEKTWGTAVQAAVSSGDPDTVLVLLRCQAKPEASHLKAVLSAIQYAVVKRNPSCSKVLWSWLLQERASQGSHRTLVDACLDQQSGGSPESILKDLLDAALWSRNEEMVRTAAAKMEEHGCDTSAILPALASACRRGFRAIKPLLTSERFTQCHLCTASYTAAIFGRRWVLSKILEELARRGFPFSRTPVVDCAFIGAAAHGHVAIIRTLLETSHLREKFAKFSWAITRAMVIAAHRGHEDIVQECLREGADVDVPQEKDTVVSPHWREDGALAIEVAFDKLGPIKLVNPNAEITHNKIGTMDLKIEETAPSPDRRLYRSRSIYTEEWTALQAALAGFAKHTWTLSAIRDDGEITDGSQGAMQQQERIVFLMLEQGCDPNAENDSGETPIETAVRLATARVVQRLIESGVEVPGDDSLVSLAAKRGSFRIVLHLLQAGASVPRTENGSLTPEMLKVLHPRLKSADFNDNPMSMEEARRFMNRGMRALLRMILGRYSSQRARKSGSGMRAGTSGRGFLRLASNAVFGNLLVVAATAGDNESVKLLIDHGVDVNSNSEFSPATALSGAAHYGHRQVMNTLLEHGADVDGGNARTKEPLIMAIRGRQLMAVKTLIEHGARPSPASPSADAYQEAVALDDTRILDFFLKHSGPPETTILVSAAADGKANHVRLLLAAGARVDDLVSHPRFDNAPAGRGTALYIACLNGHTKVVEQLLGEGANPNLDIKSTNGLGLPLTAAAGAGHLDIVRLLLDNGADPNGHSFAPTDGEASSRDDDEEWETDVDELAPTALSEACRNNHPAIVKELLSQGATISVGTTDVVTNPLTVLSTGPWSTARKEMLEQLLETVSEEATDERKQAVRDALTEAALDHNCDAFELIMEYVASSPYTLGLASICGSERSVLRCLDQGVDVNAVNPSGELPLQHAAYNMHSGVVQLLIDRGADVNQLEYIVEDNGQNSTTALMAALSSFLLMLQGDHTRQRTRDRLAILDMKRIVQCLLDSGANPELGCLSNHIKALHIACCIGDPSLVNLLLDRGARFDSDGSYHSTLLFSALDWKRPRVVRLLLERGADPNAPRVLGRDVRQDEGGEDGNRLQTPLEAALGKADNMVLLKTFLQYAKALKVSGRALVAAAQQFASEDANPTVSELQVILESEAGSLVDGIPSEALDILDRSWVRNEHAVWDIVALRSGDRARVDELRKERRTRFPPSWSSRPTGMLLLSEYRTMMEGRRFQDVL